MVKITWIIARPKENIILEFETSRFFKWLITKLMSKRKIKFRAITKDKLRGYQTSIIYVDEFK